MESGGAAGIERRSEDDPSLLVVVIDTNPFAWAKRTNAGSSSASDGEPVLIDLHTFLEHMSVFLKAFMMLHAHNLLAVIASHVTESRYLFPPTGEDVAKEELKHKMHNFEFIKTHIHNGLLRLAQEPVPSENQESKFSAALSLALCHINRLKTEHSGAGNLSARLLVVQVSPDVSAQYIPIMNCIFSAQKQNIPVDSCILSSHESTFLQQAAHLTDGIYLKPSRQDGLLQYLLSTFIVDCYSRRFLYLPRQTDVDYRASCFCHKKVIDMGYVCSVCLSST
ncbi:General transcription and DNA repair factor IIH subunit TFB4 [Balamuthia mandrillaris]